MEYDSAGNLTSSVDRLANRTTYAYDESGNLTRETFEPLEKVTTHTYDSRGNRLSTTDPLGNTSTSTYDARNNLLSEADPLGNTTSYTYDGAGRLITTLRTNGFVERFHITILDEFLHEAFNKKFYASVTELQVDLDVWLRHNNYRRPRRGYRHQGRKAYETFTRAKKEVERIEGRRKDKEEKKEEAWRRSKGLMGTGDSPAGS